MQAQKIVKDTDTLRSVPDLAALWIWQVRLNGGLERNSLTRKEFGQLKMLRHTLGELTGEVITRLIQDWYHFSFLARDTGGVSCAPDTPHIGFMLAHLQLAIQVTYQFARRAQTKSAADIEFMRKMRQAFGLGEAATQTPAVKAASEQPVAEPTPLPIKHVPIKVGFTPEQISLICGDDECEQYKAFMAALRVKYGEDCIINGRYTPGHGQILCDIPI